MLAFALALLVPLSPQLEQWRAEIEQTGGIVTHILSLPPGPSQSEIPLPPDAPDRALLLPFASNPNFASQFRAAQALSVHTGQPQPGSQRAVSFVLVNPSLSGEGDQLEALLAHELGHLWLKANKYPAPVYSGAESGCIAIHAGDAVQHVLIRAEMEKRGIPWRKPWIASLEQALAALNADRGKPSAVPARCQALALVTLWVDAALGANPSSWPRQQEFFDAISHRFPAVAPVATEIAAQLRALDLASLPVHRQALGFTFARLKALALSLPPGG